MGIVKGGAVAFDSCTTSWDTTTYWSFGALGSVRNDGGIRVVIVKKRAMIPGCSVTLAIPLVNSVMQRGAKCGSIPEHRPRLSAKPPPNSNQTLVNLSRRMLSETASLWEEACFVFDQPVVVTSMTGKLLESASSHVHEMHRELREQKLSVPAKLQKKTCGCLGRGINVR